MKIHTGICNYCNKEYSRPRPLRSKFCSIKCVKQSKKIIDMRQCLCCKINFNTRPWKDTKYCSSNCFYKHKTERTRRSICLQCGISYLRLAGNTDQKYCSTTCMGLAKTKPDPILICKFCGCSFNPSRKQDKQGTCSYSCSQKYRAKIKNGVDYMSVRSYKAERLKTNPSCERCGWSVVPEILEVHHKDRNRKNNTKPNLILICPNCHSIDHFLARDGQFASNLGKLKEVA